MGLRGPKPLTSEQLALRGSDRAAGRKAQEQLKNLRIASQSVEIQHKIPPFLSSITKRWVRGVLARGEFNETEFQLLLQAAGALDRVRQARDELKKAGSLTVATPTGDVKAHPLCAVENQARSAFARICHQLQLDHCQEEI